MKYLLDKNILAKDLTTNIARRDDLCVTEDVLAETTFTEQEINKIKQAGIKVIKLGKKHLEKLKIVLKEHGDNLKLIDLYTGKGTADVTMLAFVLAERESPETLFDEEYTIVTRDEELKRIASTYDIKFAEALD